MVQAGDAGPLTCLISSIEGGGLPLVTVGDCAYLALPQFICEYCQVRALTLRGSHSHLVMLLHAAGAVLFPCRVCGVLLCILF